MSGYDSLEYLAPGLSAAVVVLIIEFVVRYYLYKKRCFEEILSIQVALQQIIGVTLQMRQHVDDVRSSFFQVYSERGFRSPEQVWKNFKHIDLSCWMNTFEVVCFEWNFSQFLSRKNDVGRKLLNHLIPIRLGFQSLMYISTERNKMLADAHQIIDREMEARMARSDDFIYLDSNLVSMLGLPLDRKLRDITDRYIQTLDHVIIDAENSFKAVSVYISKKFCFHDPMNLVLNEDMRELLARVKTTEAS